MHPKGKSFNLPETPLDETGEQHSARQYTVWSDLRAMRFLSQVQQDMRSLKTSNSRLQLLLTIVTLVLGGITIALAIFLGVLYNQMQDLRQEVQELPRSQVLPEIPASSSPSQLT